MKIQELPSCERPRERMMLCGARAMSNAELLAIILRTGTAHKNAVEMGIELLRSVNGSLTELSGRSVEGMCKVSGIGRGKALQIAAALELARRMIAESAEAENSVVRTPEDAWRNCLPLFGSNRHEECWCLFLKSNRKLLGSMQVSSGGESTTFINNKAILRKALDVGARAVILCHNHPSGDVSPSEADIKATELLNDSLRSFDIALMDHIILGEDSWFSFNKNEKFLKSGKICKKM